MVRTSKYAHITPILKSLHWLKIKERIIYKTSSLIYKCISTTKLGYLSELLTLQQLGPTRSTSLVTLKRRYNPSCCKISGRSFQYAAPDIWNSLPSFLRERGDSDCSIGHSHRSFHRKLKTCLFGLSFPITSAQS